MNKITAIIVTYNIGEEYKKNLASVLPQVEKAIIVDNSVQESSREFLTELQNQHKEKLDVIFNGANIGLAKAQNIGIELALKNKPEWMLFLDDDSIPKADMVSNMFAAYVSSDGKDDVAILAPYIKEINTKIEPRYVIRKWGIFFYRAKFGHRETMEVMAAIASGSLIKTSIIEKLGKFRDDFFIDYIDTEYCLRVRAAGYRIIAVKSAVMSHILGNKTSHKIGGFEIITSNHPPHRRFTIYRNRAVLWKKYLFKTPIYILYDITAAIYDILRISLFEEDKSAKLKHAVNGFWIGLVKK